MFSPQLKTYEENTMESIYLFLVRRLLRMKFMIRFALWLLFLILSWMIIPVDFKIAYENVNIIGDFTLPKAFALSLSLGMLYWHIALANYLQKRIKSNSTHH